MLQDYKVRFRREDSIAERALLCREFARNEKAANFNIVEFVEQFLPLILIAVKKGPLQIEFIDAQEGEKKAWVIYKPRLTLYIDREIWELAKQGDPDSRFIVAHEVGHIILHDHHAKAFSVDPGKHFADNEERAEWQANKFASHLLLTAQVLDKFDNVDDLVRYCDIPRPMAKDRLADLNDAKRRARARTYTGDCCGNCGNFTVAPVCQGTQCDSCGHRESYPAPTPR